MAGRSVELVRGTLDVMVLKALSRGPTHGYAVSRWLRECTDGTLDVEDAALYQALHRMQARGWLDAEWGRSENNRRAKFYRLTPAGRRQLGDQANQVRRYVAALLQVLDAGGPGATAHAPAGA